MTDPSSRKRKRTLTPRLEDSKYTRDSLQLDSSGPTEIAESVIPDIDVVVHHLKKFITRPGISSPLRNPIVLHILTSHSEAVYLRDFPDLNSTLREAFYISDVSVLVDKTNTDCLISISSLTVDSIAKLAAFISFILSAKLNNYSPDQFTLRLMNYRLTVLVSFQNCNENILADRHFVEMQISSAKAHKVKSVLASGRLSANVPFHLSWPDTYNRNPNFYRVMYHGDMSSVFHSLCTMIHASSEQYYDPVTIIRPLLFGNKPDPALDSSIEERQILALSSRAKLMELISSQ